MCSDHKCLRAVKLKNKRWKKWSKSSNYNDFVEYKIARNKTVKAVRKAKLKFEKKLAKQVKEDPKSCFAYVISISKTKDKIGSLNDNNGNAATDNGEMCEILNTFFCSVFTDEDVNKLPEPKCIFLDDDSNKLCNFVITKDKVYNKLSQLKENKAPGPDRLSPKLLKKIKMKISEPLCSIFNRSLQDSSVPEDWKIANVTPIFKKGSKLSAGN